MLRRRSLISLAVFTIVCFAIAGGVGNDGAVQVLADIAWYGFWLGLLLLIVASGFVLVRSARRRAT